MGATFVLHDRVRTGPPAPRQRPDALGSLLDVGRAVEPLTAPP